MPFDSDTSSQTEDLTRDGSLRKTILTPGRGDPAGRGARVSVRYTLRLSVDPQSPEIDSSSRRKDGVLAFTLGRRKVIPALELVAQSMRLGESCRARAAATYAFGARGLKRKGVPPNAAVFLWVDMVSVEGGGGGKPLTDMSPTERFEMAATCKEKGNAFFKEQKYDKALSQYSQSIRYLSNVFYRPSTVLGKSKATSLDAEMDTKVDVRKEEGNDDDASETGGQTAEIATDTHSGEQNEDGFQEADVVHENTNVETAKNKTHDEVPRQSSGDSLSGEEIVRAVVDSIVRTATGEEESQDTLSAENSTIFETQGKYHGNSEKEQVEGESISDGHGTNAIEDIYLAQKENRSDQRTSSMERAMPSPTELSSRSNAKSNSTENPSNLKTSPDKSTENSHHIQASKHKEQITSDEETAPEADDPEEEEVRALHVTTLNNLSLCFVKLEDYKQAVDSASQALKIDPRSSKALYYRGRAEIALGEWDVARADLVAAAKIQPNNPGIRNEIIKLDRKKKQFEEREKKQAAAMFA